MSFDSLVVPNLSKVPQAVPGIATIDDIKRLAGIGQGVYDNQVHGRCDVQLDLATQRRKIERDRKIQPGTPEWFRLWFAKPNLTGERPYDESQ